MTTVDISTPAHSEKFFNPEGAVHGDHPMRHPMPRPLVRPTVAPMTIEGLFFGHEKIKPDVLTREYPWADRFILGLPLAPWQREFKWSPEQCQRFIMSAWTGVFLGAYILTAAEYRREDSDFRGVEYLPLTNMILDGQQRLKALDLYVSNQLAVPDANGQMALWSEVSDLDKRRFKKIIFNRGELRKTDEHELRRTYDLLNFGGIAHEEHERALSAKGALANSKLTHANPTEDLWK